MAAKKASKKVAKKTRKSPPGAASGQPAMADMFPDLHKEIEATVARAFKNWSDLMAPWKMGDFDPFAKSDFSMRMSSPFGKLSVDFTEGDDQYELTADLPGMDKNDIEVTLSGGMLTIRGEKKEEKDETAKGYFLQERQFGSFLRSFPIPENADPFKVNASFSKGVLKIQIPKLAAAKKDQRKIDIKS